MNTNLQKLLTLLAERNTLLLHLLRLDSQLPEVRRHLDTNNPEVQIGYLAGIQLAPITLDQFICFLPISIDRLKNLTPESIVKYLAGLTYHYLGQLSQAEFQRLANQLNAKPLCDAFTTQQNRYLASISVAIRPKPLLPVVDTKKLLRGEDERMLDLLKPKL